MHLSQNETNPVLISEQLKWDRTETVKRQLLKFHPFFVTRDLGLKKLVF